MSNSVEEIKRREAGQAPITPDDRGAGQVSFFSVNRRQVLLLGVAATLLIAVWYLRRQDTGADEEENKIEATTAAEPTIHVPTDPIDQLEKDAAIVNSEIFAGAKA